MAVKTTRATVTVKPDQPYGEVSRFLYGHFSEHLHRVVYGGLWAELLEHRKFEMPGLHSHLPQVAPGWEAIEPEGARVHRGDSPEAYQIGPDAHHQQLVSFGPAGGNAWAGIRQRGIALDAGVTYEAKAWVQAVGPVERLRFALGGPDGETVGVELELPAEARLENRFSPEPRHGVLAEARLRGTAAIADGWFSFTGQAPRGEAELWIHALSLLPEGHLDGLHGGAAAALRELPAVIVKYPGGCFADSYDWRLGIGPRERRHGSPDYAWGTWDENDFGTDEFLRWCEATGTTPYLCVNQGSAGPELAAAWVEYCNGPADRGQGARRAANGHPEPYGVPYWAIGNEVYGWWERGGLDAAAYAERVRGFAAAMKAVDPSIKIAAQGDTGDYSRRLLELVGTEIDWLSVHHYSSPLEPRRDAPRYLGMAQDFERVVGGVAEAIRTTPGAEHVRIALDEWGWSSAADHGQVAVAYTACVLNALTRLAPYVAMAGHCCVMNPMAPVTRQGENVVRTRLFDLFSLYHRLHRGTSVHASAEDGVDVSAFSDASGISVLAANTRAEPVAVRVDGLAGPVRSWRVHDGGTEAGAGEEIELGPYEVAGFTTP